MGGECAKRTKRSRLRKADVNKGDLRRFAACDGVGGSVAEVGRVPEQLVTSKTGIGDQEVRREAARGRS